MLKDSLLCIAAVDIDTVRCGHVSNPPWTCFPCVRVYRRVVTGITTGLKRAASGVTPVIMLQLDLFSDPRR
jgi:hypothetical protein